MVDEKKKYDRRKKIKCVGKKYGLEYQFNKYNDKVEVTFVVKRVDNY